MNDSFLNNNDKYITIYISQFLQVEDFLNLQIINKRIYTLLLKQRRLRRRKRYQLINKLKRLCPLKPVPLIVKKFIPIKTTYPLRLYIQNNTIIYQINKQSHFGLYFELVLPSSLTDKNLDINDIVKAELIFNDVIIKSTKHFIDSKEFSNVDNWYHRLKTQSFIKDKSSVNLSDITLSDKKGQIIDWSEYHVKSLVSLQKEGFMTGEQILSYSEEKCIICFKFGNFTCQSTEEYKQILKKKKYFYDKLWIPSPILQYQDIRLITTFNKLIDINNPPLLIMHCLEYNQIYSRKNIPYNKCFLYQNYYIMKWFTDESYFGRVGEGIFYTLKDRITVDKKYFKEGKLTKEFYKDKRLTDPNYKRYNTQGFVNKFAKELSKEKLDD